MGDQTATKKIKKTKHVEYKYTQCGTLAGTVVPIIIIHANMCSVIFTTFLILSFSTVLYSKSISNNRPGKASNSIYKYNYVIYETRIMFCSRNILHETTYIIRVIVVHTNF